MAVQSALERSITRLNHTDVCSIMSCWRTALLYLYLSKGKSFCTAYFFSNNQSKERICIKLTCPVFSFIPKWFMLYQKMWNELTQQLTWLACPAELSSKPCFAPMHCSDCHSFQFSVINLTKEKKCFSSLNRELRGCFIILLSEDRALRGEVNE